MARKIIKLAGGQYKSLKALSGAEALKGREVVVTMDTKELFVGNGDDTYSLLGSAIFGTKNDLYQTDSLKGRFFFDTEKETLYLANGVGWKRIGIRVSDFGGLTIDPESSKLSINTDNQTIIIDQQNKLKVNIDDKTLKFNNEKLGVNIDSNSLILDNESKISVGNTDYGVF